MLGKQEQEQMMSEASNAVTATHNLLLGNASVSEEKRIQLRHFAQEITKIITHRLSHLH